jgi:hypothetical protein
VTAGWRQLHRGILITTHDWSISQPAPPPARWGLVADVAAIAQAVSILDVELARDARATGLPGYLVRILRDARTSPLRLAARETLDLALRRPRADRWIPTGAPDRAKVVDIDTEGLEPALAHLAQVMNQGDLKLSAPDALKITRCVGKTSLLIGRRLQGTPADHVGAMYARHGEALLNAVRGAHGQIQSLTLSPDHGPAIQAHHVLKAVGDAMSGPDATQVPDTVRAVAMHVGDITTGILDVFMRAKATGAWITIDHRARRYRPTHAGDLPDSTKHLLEAHRHVAELGPSRLPRSTMEIDSPLAAHHQLIAAGAIAPIMRADIVRGVLGVTPAKLQPNPHFDHGPEPGL